MSFLGPLRYTLSTTLYYQQYYEIWQHLSRRRDIYCNFYCINIETFISFKGIKNSLLLNCNQPSHVTLHTSDIMVIYHKTVSNDIIITYILLHLWNSCTILYFIVVRSISFIPCYFVGGTFSSDLSPFVSMHSVSGAAHL